MRDHLLGFPPLAANTAQHDEDDEFFNYFPDYCQTYPLGVPKRAVIEHTNACAEVFGGTEAQTKERQRLRDFDSKAHPYPDGTFDPYKGMRVTCVGLQTLLVNTLEKRADQVFANVTRNNALLMHKGISVKPAPGGVINTACTAAELKSAMQKVWEENGALVEPGEIVGLAARIGVVSSGSIPATWTFRRPGVVADGPAAEKSEFTFREVSCNVPV